MMENLVNKVILTGSAAADVEVITLPQNLKLARVNIAIDESTRLLLEKILGKHSGLP